MSTYSLEKKETVDKIFAKLAKKNPKQLYMIYKKLEQITKDPYRFKPLRSDMKETREVVILKDYGHHDDIFGK
jgi:mRNA-degrading endonuclease RelE of RelBE toxin-antitoxin system